MEVGLARVAWMGAPGHGHSALMPLTLPLIPIRTAGHTVSSQGISQGTY